MVRDEDAVDPLVERAPGVVGVEHPLEHDREAGQPTQAGEVGPGQRGLREHLEERLDRRPRLGGRQVAAGVAGVVAAQRHQRAYGGRGGPRLRLGLGARGGRHPLVDQPPEHRVGGVLRDALPAGERQVAEVEVAGAPAQVGRVEGDDEGLAPARLRAVHQALDEVVVVAPVQLVPVPGPAHGPGHLLHRHRRLGAQHRGDPLLEGARGDGEVGVGVCRAQHPDRRGEQRGGVPPPEQLDPEVAAARVDEHAGHDPPPVEGVAVGPGGRLATGRPGDVREAAAGHGPAGGVLEGRSVGRHPRPATEGAGAVDGGLGGAPEVGERHAASFVGRGGRTAAAACLPDRTGGRNPGPAVGALTLG